MLTASRTEGSSKSGPFKSYIRKSAPRVQFGGFPSRNPSNSRLNERNAISNTPTTAAETAVPTELKPEIDDFKSLVTEYGRSIIKSAMDHEPEEAATLKEDIMTAKEKIIVKYKTAENELEIAEAEIRTLKSSVFDLRLEKATSVITKRLDGSSIKALEKRLGDQSDEMRRCTDLLEEETEKRNALELDLADLKKDRKRKRESVAAIWEDAESIKLE
jgi:chromosome segregation ATPase